MVEMKTIGITTLLIMLSGTTGYLLFNNVDFSKDNYYCESRTDIGVKQCDSLVKYGVENGKCVIGQTSFICKTGWVKIVNDMQINKQVIENNAEKTKVYICDNVECKLVQ